MSTKFTTVTGGAYPADPVTGACVYNEDTNTPEWFNGTTWEKVSTDDLPDNVEYTRVSKINDFMLKSFGEMKTPDENMPYITAITKITSSATGVWIATYNNGYISRSEDNGATWTAEEALTNEYGNISYNAHAVTTDNNGVWIIAGDNGIFSRSTDDGQTWTNLPRGLAQNGLDGEYYEGKNVVTDDNGNWLVYQSDGFINLSSDNGATWTEGTRYFNGDSEIQPEQNCIDTDGSGKWIATSYNRKALESSDNGATWTAYTDDIFGLVDADGTVESHSNVKCNRNTGTWIATDSSYGKTMVSTDGVNWTQNIQNDTNTFGAVSGALAYSGTSTWIMADGNGPNATISNDNGATWFELPYILNNTSDQIYEYRAITSDKNNKWVVSFNSGYVSSSDDNGVTWTTEVRGLGNGEQQASTVIVKCSTTGVRLSGAQDMDLTHRYSGGVWTESVPYFNTGQEWGNIRDMATDNAGKWIVIGEDGYASTSEDDGVSFTPLERGLGLGNEMNGYPNYNKIYCDGSLWVVLGHDGNTGEYLIHHSTDGVTWTTKITGTEHSLNKAMGDGAGTWIVGSRYPWRSDDNGVTWTALPEYFGIDNPDGHNYHGMITDNAGFWIYAYSSNILARSDDNGVTWTQSEKLDNDNSGYDCNLYYTTDGLMIGVYNGSSKIRISNDNGISWSTEVNFDEESHINIRGVINHESQQDINTVVFTHNYGKYSEMKL